MASLRSLLKATVFLPKLSSRGLVLVSQNFIRQGTIFQPLPASSLSVRYSSALSLAHPSVQKYLQTCQDTIPAHSELSRVVKAIIEKQNEIKDLLEMGRENADLREMAEADAEKARKTLAYLEREFFGLVVEPEPMDYCSDVVLEVSAGVGGQEAMLFSKELLDMYGNYACYKGWDCQVIGLEQTELGGIRHGSLSISGPGAYKFLKFEGGVHRVQRVPKTEKSGRIHTSASTVAILPTPTEIDVVINPQDLKIETKRASGAGGQHVNKTESAIRITHLPSGIVVECQTERHQNQNKNNALKTLRARLFQEKADKQAAQLRKSRKLQVGMGGRNEKIRTYNYVQDRVTDHRIGLTVHNLEGVLDGNESLDEIVNNLQDFDVQEKLHELFK